MRSMRKMFAWLSRGVQSGLPCLALIVFFGMMSAQQVNAVADGLGTPATRAKNVIPGRFHMCDNEEVGKFVGKDRVAVLATIKKMNLRTLRVLDGNAPVNFEVVPDRLTLVLSDRGVVTRSFCR